MCERRTLVGEPKGRVADCVWCSAVGVWVPASVPACACFPCSPFSTPLNLSLAPAFGLFVYYWYLFLFVWVTHFTTECHRYSLWKAAPPPAIFNSCFLDAEWEPRSVHSLLPQWEALAREGWNPLHPLVFKSSVMPRWLYTKHQCLSACEESFDSGERMVRRKIMSPSQ